MKKVALTIKEFYLFKDIANFFYDVSIHQHFIIIEADSHQLEKLGY